MFNTLLSVNWFGVLLGTLALSVLGAVWYMALFGRPYAAALGRADLTDQKPSPLFIVGPLACGAVVTTTTALLLQLLAVTTYGGALQFGALVGIGYLAATTVNVAINPNVPRPFLYGLVSGGYFLVGSLLVSVILVAMS